MTRVEVRGTTRVAAVLGYPVEHSRSPAMLNAAFVAAGVDAVMVPIGVAPERLAACVRGLAASGFLGASVTMPHKEAVAALCDERSPAADALGVVNCLQIAGGRVIGHNTDGGGFVDALAERRFAPAGKTALLLGAGGAARAVAAALTAAGAQVDVIARRPDAVAWTRARAWTAAELRAGCAAAALVVDCTPAGLDPAREAEVADAVPLDACTPTTMIATLVYHRRTRLLALAALRQLATLDGRGMLVHQGARAFTLWTGRPAPIGAMAAGLDANLQGES